MVDAELKVIVSDFFTSKFLTTNHFQHLKNDAFLINNVTMASPHEINLEDDSFTGILLKFYSVKSLCLKISAINGSIITKSKGYDV